MTSATTTQTGATRGRRSFSLLAEPGPRTALAVAAAFTGWLLAWSLLTLTEIRPPLVWWWTPPLLTLLLLSGSWRLGAGRIVVVLAAVVLVLVPALRVTAAPFPAIEAALLSQSAVEHLWDARNPYTADHTDAVDRSAYPMDAGERFVGLQYPPLAWLPFPVFEAPSRVLTGTADPRPAYGFIAVALAVALVWRARSLEQLAWAAAATSSGFVAMTVTEGTHDVVVIALLVAAIAIWHRPVAAGALVGLAAAVKTLAWPLLPVVALALTVGASRRTQLATLAAIAGPLTVTSAPFILWDAEAFLRGILFLDDLARPGTLSLRQPIIDVVGVDLAWPVRIAVVVAVLAAALHWRRAGRLTAAAAVGLMVAITVGVQLFSTVFYVYHLALPVALLVALSLFRRPPTLRTDPGQRAASP